MVPSTIPTPTGVRCGNRAYHGTDVVYHASAAAVRECYANTGTFARPGLTAFKASAPAPAPQPTLVEGKQPVSFEAFLEANEWFDGELSKDQERAAYQRYLAQFDSVTVESAVARMQASAQSEADRAQVARDARYAAWATIPVGQGDYANYALQDGDHVRFYRVERPSEGKYAGKTYLKRYVSDEVVKTGWAETCNALDAIAADPETAAVLYGRETKRCAICHRKLTDDKNKGSDGLTSLERGIGPKCAKRVQG